MRKFAQSTLLFSSRQGIHHGTGGSPESRAKGTIPWSCGDVYDVEYKGFYHIWQHGGQLSCTQSPRTDTMSRYQGTQKKISSTKTMSTIECLKSHAKGMAHNSKMDYIFFPFNPHCGHSTFILLQLLCDRTHHAKYHIFYISPFPHQGIC